MESGAGEGRNPLGKKQNGGVDGTEPLIVRAAFGCRRNRCAVNAQTAVVVYLLALLLGRAGIKIQAECRGQHGRGESSACSPLASAVMSDPCSLEIYPYI